MSWNLSAVTVATTLPSIPLPYELRDLGPLHVCFSLSHHQHTYLNKYFIVKSEKLLIFKCVFILKIDFDTRQI